VLPPGGDQPDVSIRCSSASTAEPKAKANTPMGWFLFAARQRVQRNALIKSRSFAQVRRFLFAARQRVQRNSPTGTCSSRPPRFYSLLVSEYSGTDGHRDATSAPSGFYSLLVSEYSGTSLIATLFYISAIVSIRCSSASTAEPYPSGQGSDQHRCRPLAHPPPPGMPRRVPEGPSKRCFRWSGAVHTLSHLAQISDPPPLWSPPAHFRRPERPD